MSRRIRTIKPELLDDEKTGRLSHEAHRLFVGSILLADDHGNLRADPEWLRGQVFWGKEADAKTALHELATVGLVSLYEAKGQRYAHLNGWESHQRVDKPGKPRVPLPDDGESLANIPESPATDRDPDHDQGAPTTEGDQPQPSSDSSSEVRSGIESLPPEALKLADWLRKHILAAKPTHAIGKGETSDTKWRDSVTRRKWAVTADRMHRIDRRDYRRSARLVVWLFGDNLQREVSFVVESMDALRDKWDRVDAAERKARAA